MTKDQLNTVISYETMQVFNTHGYESVIGITYL